MLFNPARRAPRRLIRLTLLWTSVAHAASLGADQCTYFDARAAALVRAAVTPGTILLSACQPCASRAPVPLRVHSVDVERDAADPRVMRFEGQWYSEAQIRRGAPASLTAEERGSLLESMARVPRQEFRLRVNGVVQDLAYLYIPDAGDAYRNLGVIAQCATDVAPTIRYTLANRDPARARPPLPHFEEITGHGFDGSCVLKEWQVNAPATLLGDKVRSAALIGEIGAGERVRVEQLVAEIHPVAAKVVFDHGRFFAGDEFYILNSLGEGYHRVWHYGQIVDEDLSGISTSQTATAVPHRCAVPSTECWAETAGHSEEVWWALVVTRAERRGWLRDPQSVVESVLERE